MRSPDGLGQQRGPQHRHGMTTMTIMGRHKTTTTPGTCTAIIMRITSTITTTARNSSTVQRR